MVQPSVLPEAAAEARPESELWYGSPGGAAGLIGLGWVLWTVGLAPLVAASTTPAEPPPLPAAPVAVVPSSTALPGQPATASLESAPVPAPPPAPEAPAMPSAPAATEARWEIGFSRGSANLSRNEARLVAEAADALAGTEGPILIEGHTDAVGDELLNLRLSRFRAKVVARALIRKGVARDRLVVRAFGDYQPKPGEGVIGEGQRRVEIRWMEKRP